MKHLNRWLVFRINNAILPARGLPIHFKPLSRVKVKVMSKLSKSLQGIQDRDEPAKHEGDDHPDAGR